MINSLIANKSFKDKVKSLIKYFIFILPLFSILISFLQHDLNIWGNYEQFFFHSDAVHFNGISKNILTWKGNFTDWLLPGAPRYFPTFILTFIIAFLTKNYFLTQIIFLIAQAIIFNLLFVIILDVFLQRDHSTLLVGIFNLFLIFFLHFPPFNYMFMADHHFGTFINMLISLTFILKLKTDKYYWIIILNFMFFLFTFSNPIFLILFILPLIIRNIILSNRFSFNFVNNFSFLIVSLIAIYLKKIIYSHLNCSSCNPTYQNVDTITFDNIIVSLYHIKEFFLTHSKALQNFFVSLSLALPLIFLLLKFKKKQLKDLSEKKLTIFIILFFSAIFTISSFTFLNLNPQFRHLYTLYFSGFIYIPLVFHKAISKFLKAFYSKVLICIFSLSFFLSAKNIDLDKNLNFDFYPEEIKYIDSILNELNLQNGIAIFSIANKLTFFSKRELKIIPHHTIKPLHWNINKKWIKSGKPEFIINMNPKLFGYSYKKIFTYKDIEVYIL